MWLQHTKLIKQGYLLEVTDKAVEDWDKMWWINASISATISGVVWEEESSAEWAMEAMAVAYKTKVFVLFLYNSLQHSKTEWFKSLKYLEIGVLVNDGDGEDPEAITKEDLEDT